MLNKKRTILAVAILTLLVVACAYFVLKDKQSYRSFQQNIVNIDTTKITDICIKLPTNDTTIIITKNSQWQISLAEKNYNANMRQISETINRIANIGAVRKISNSPSSWQKYGVTDSLGTHIVVKNGKHELANFYCGFVDFDKQNNTLWCYLRNYNDNNTYLVDGYISFALTKQPSGWVQK